MTMLDQLLSIKWVLDIEANGKTRQVSFNSSTHHIGGSQFLHYVEKFERDHEMNIFELIGHMSRFVVHVLSTYEPDGTPRKLEFSV